MKRVIVVAAAALCACALAGGKNRTEVKIYYADRRLYKLIPVETVINKTSPEKTAEQIVEKLEECRGSDEIIRLVPKNCGITVKVRGNAAEADIPSSLSENLPKNRESERLFVYQLVNSFTSVPGIDSVVFTIDGERKKNFVGFVDMREIFVPDYDM